MNTDGATKTRKLTTVSIPRSMVKEIDKMAAEDDRSRSNQVMLLLREILAVKRRCTLVNRENNVDK